MFTDLIVTVISVVLFRLSFHFLFKYLCVDFSFPSFSLRSLKIFKKKDVSEISDLQEDVSELPDNSDCCELPDKYKDFIQLN